MAASDMKTILELAEFEGNMDENSYFPLVVKVDNHDSTQKVKFINLKSQVKNYIELTSTLSTGSTTVTFTNEAITTNSTIDVYTSVFGVNPTDITLSAGSMTITFDAQDADIGVKVRIS